MNNIKGPIILDNAIGTPVAPGGYVGMGQATPETDPDSSGPRAYAGVGDPSGVLQAPIGSLWVESVTGAWFRNTDGGTAWSGISGTTAAGSRVVYVDGGRTDTYTENGSFDTPYKTVQAAVNFAEASLGPSIDSPVVIDIAPYPGPTGFYPENVVIKKSGVSLRGAGDAAGTYLQRLIITNATSASLATFIGNGGLTNPNANWGDLVADSYGPTGDNQIQNIGLWDGTGTDNLLFEFGVGAGNTVAQATHYFFHFTNYGKTFLRGVNSVDFRECYLVKEVDTVNVSQCSIARCFLQSYVGDYDTGLDEPANGNTIGLYGGNGTSFNGGITLNNAAKVGGGFDGFNDVAITGNIDVNGTASFVCGPGLIYGNIDVEGDATFYLRGTQVQGALTLDNAGGLVPCTFDAGAYMGALTDVGVRLVRNAGS